MTLGTSQGTLENLLNIIDFVVFAPVTFDGLKLVNKIGAQRKNLAPVGRSKLREVAFTKMKRCHRHADLTALAHNSHNVMRIEL